MANRILEMARIPLDDCQDIDWKKAKEITAGVDIGAVSSQAVVMCDGEFMAIPTCAPARVAKTAPEKPSTGLWKAPAWDLKNIREIVATGYGSAGADFAGKALNETICHAKGARFMFGPTVQTVFDMGGQTCKAIKLYKWDRIADLAVNDKCAVSMGWGIEILADLMHVPITEMGEKSLAVNKNLNRSARPAMSLPILKPSVYCVQRQRKSGPGSLPFRGCRQAPGPSRTDQSGERVRSHRRPGQESGNREKTGAGNGLYRPHLQVRSAVGGSHRRGYSGRRIGQSRRETA